MDADAAPGGTVVVAQLTVPTDSSFTAKLSAQGHTKSAIHAYWSSVLMLHALSDGVKQVNRRLERLPLGAPGRPTTSSSPKAAVTSPAG
jgi:hypothetical protein